MAKAEGFRPARTIYKLNFSQTELAGLEVRARATSVEGLMDIMGIGAEVDGLDTEKITLGELKQKLTRIFAPFADVLHSWNVLDEDDEPVPATMAGLLSQELPFVMTIIEAYIGAVAQAPPPLPSRSPATGTSPEAAAALAAQSRPLPS